MEQDFDRLASYVRFYLTVRTQLGAAWDNLVRTHDVVREALAPFADPLAPLESPVLAAALTVQPSSPERLAALWKPDDEASLGGFTDVYEVVGRFAFQGEDNQNLARVQALVSGARNEIVAQRMRLGDLGKLPELSRACAGKLAAQEVARADADRAEKSAAFGPLSEAVAARAKQTIDAVKGVPFPDLSNADTAAEEYKRYTARLDQVYQTCLPFLRKAIAGLYGFVGCEPGASWPDALPLERALPAELVTVPPADSPELSAARTNVLGLGEEEITLARARDEAGAAIARIEGEMAAALMKDKEIEVEIGTTSQVIDYLAAAEQAEAARQAIALLEEQKAHRVRAGGQVTQRYRTLEASIKVTEEELKARAEEITAVDTQLSTERGEEPVLFGKDTWRQRVSELEAELEGRKAAYGQRQNQLNQLRIELSAAGVDVQTEQAQNGLVDRQLADTRERLVHLLTSIKEMGATLGSSRPARPVPLTEAHAAAAMLQQGRAELVQRLDRLKAEVRRQKDEGLRILARLKQIGVERQHMEAMLQSTQVAATQGREAALKQLAAQRRAAVERHVSEVLGTLEKSLSLVGPVFIDPAREAMLKGCEPRAEVSAGVLENAEKVAPIVDKLARELDPELLAQDAMLGQIQREFCDVALEACRSAWS
jgi:hypothetical protein